MKDTIKNYCQNTHELNCIYEEYARKRGYSYLNLCLLTLIYDNEHCTQKMLCDYTFLPKQTINTNIINLVKENYLILEQFEQDKRIKEIRLTKKGLDTFEEIIKEIHNSEKESFNSLSEYQKEILVEATKIYAENFRKNLIK